MGQDTRPPRGALAVIAVGLIASAAEALLSTDQPIGATELAWGAQTPIPASKPVAIPGGGTMRIGESGLRASVPNAAGYRLFRVAATLGFSRSAAIGHGRARCLVRAPAQALVAQTPNGRSSFPQPSEELSDQPVSRSLKIEFGVEGSDLAMVSLRDAFGRFTSEPGVKVEWTKYQPARQGWDWGLPGGRPAKPLTLGFATIFRTPVKPATRIACTLTTGRGTARVATTGALRK